MSLNRFSLWTTKHGIKIRVRDMSFAELFTAVDYLETLERDEACEDPYAIQAMCSGIDYCATPVEPVHMINGYILEDWHAFLNERMVLQLKIDKRIAQYPKKVPNLFVVLAKRLKFW